MTVGKTKDGSELPANLYVSVQSYWLYGIYDSHPESPMIARLVQKWMIAGQVKVPRDLPHLGISRTIIDNKRCVT
jgi:hypothetical protein